MVQRDIYYEENFDRILAWNSNRIHGKRQRGRPWKSKEHSKKINEIFLLAKELQWLSEEKLEIDHIIPLCGDNVSGLHVYWNLQILNKTENLIKNNSFDGTYDNEGWRKK